METRFSFSNIALRNSFWGRAGEIIIFCDAQTGGAKAWITAHKSSEHGLCICSPCRVWDSFCTLHTDCVHYFQGHYIQARVQSNSCQRPACFSTLEDVCKRLSVRLPVYSLQHRVRLLAINSMTCWSWLLDMVSYKQCSFIAWTELSYPFFVILCHFKFHYSNFSSKRINKSIWWYRTWYFVLFANFIIFVALKYVQLWADGLTNSFFTENAEVYLSGFSLDSIFRMEPLAFCPFYRTNPLSDMGKRSIYTRHRVILDYTFMLMMLRSKLLRKFVF